MPDARLVISELGPERVRSGTVTDLHPPRTPPVITPPVVLIAQLSDTRAMPPQTRQTPAQRRRETCSLRMNWAPAVAMT